MHPPLLLFTHRFPYGPGEQFLEPELSHLVDRFGRVILVPRQVRGERRRLPDGVDVELSLVERQAVRASRQAKLRQCLTSRWFYREALSHSGPRSDTRVLRRAADFLVNALRARDWIVSYLRGPGPGAGGLCYSYWIQPETLAALLAKEQLPRLRVVSRAHRGDVYEDRAVPPYLPFRQIIFERLDRLFTIAEHGRQYLTERYPTLASKCEVARLGVPDPGFVTSGSSADELRIVSCSFLTPVKRVDRLIRALRVLSDRSPGLRIEWHHIGDGPLEPALARLAAKALGARVRWRFHGYLSNDEILEFYRSSAVDVFVNLSESEGIPVSIMEAQSCGIPVIGTVVGGVPEIVDAENGVLLGADPTPEEVADALARFVPDCPGIAVARAASRESWRTRYRADPNHSAFAERLAALLLVDGGLSDA